MEFSRPEYWSGQVFPSPGDLPNPAIKPRSPTLQVDSLPAEPQGKPKNTRAGPIPSPGDLPDPGIEPGSPALQVDSLPAEPPGKPRVTGGHQSKPRVWWVKAATHALLLLSPRDGSTSSLQICAGLGTNSDQLPAGETTLETPQWGLKDVLTSTPPSWCSKSNAPWAYQPHGTGKPARAEEPSQYPALRAELMFGANSDIRPSCHLSEPKGDQQKKSPLKESWRIINHCSNNKSGDGLIPWTWRKTTERDIFSIPREYI